MIEEAKSSRSRCRTCGLPIEKGSLRFGVLDTRYSDKGTWRWHHLACADQELGVELAAYLRQPDCPYTRADLQAVLRASASTGTRAPDWLPGEGRLPKWFDGVAVNVPGPDGPLDDGAVRGVLSALRTGDDALRVRMEAWLDGAHGRLAEQLLLQFEARGTLASAWIYGALEPWLAGSETRIGQAAVEAWKSSRLERVDRLVHLLADLDTDAAVLELLRLDERYHYKGQHNRVTSALRVSAHKRGCRIGDLLDTVTFGLEGDRLTFDLGDRVVTGRLRPDLSVWLFADGKRLTRLAQRKRDDAAAFASARDTLAALRPAMRSVLRLQGRRFEEAMVTQRVWRRNHFAELVAHPILGPIAAGLVWACGDAVFRVDEEGATVDLDDEPVALVAPVRVAHATALGTDAAAWAEVFEDYEIVPPFPQLARETHPPSPDAGAERWVCTPPFAVGQGPLHGVLNRRRWRKGPVLDDAHIRWFERVIDGVAVRLELEPGMAVWGSDDDQRIVGVTASRPWSEVSPVVLSEVRYDVALLSEEAR